MYINPDKTQQDTQDMCGYLKDIHNKFIVKPQERRAKWRKWLMSNPKYWLYIKWANLIYRAVHVTEFKMSNQQNIWGMGKRKRKRWSNKWEVIYEEGVFKFDKD